jgi:hypothetical protein
MPSQPDAPALLFRAENGALMSAWLDILNLAVLDHSTIRSISAAARSGLEDGVELLRATGSESLIEELQHAFELLDTEFF